MSNTVHIPKNDWPFTDKTYVSLMTISCHFYRFYINIYKLNLSETWIFILKRFTVPFYTYIMIIIYYFYIYKRENKECRVVYLWVLRVVWSVISVVVATIVISLIYIVDISHQRSFNKEYRWLNHLKVFRFEKILMHHLLIFFFFFGVVSGISSFESHLYALAWSYMTSNP